MMLGLPIRKMSVSEPSTEIILAVVPVVLANVRTLPARNPAAISRVTEDFPRVPFTWTRMGTRARDRA